MTQLVSKIDSHITFTDQPRQVIWGRYYGRDAKAMDVESTSNALCIVYVGGLSMNTFQETSNLKTEGNPNYS